MSENPNITIEFIEKHPNEEWCWGSILQNPNITMENIMEIIEKYPNEE